MAKSKNHTAHNQTRKAHRNGIHKPKWQKYTRTKGMDPKYLRNLKWAKKHNRSPSEMSKYNRKKFVTKKLAELVKKKNLRLKKKIQTAAKAQKADPTATPAVAPKMFTIATLSKYEKSRAILTPKQRTAKKWRFISRGDRRKEKIYGGSGLLKIKTILHKRYNAELAHRRLRMRKIKKTLPANTYVKFWTRTLLGPEKRIKKTHKQVLAVVEEKKKAKTKARQAKRAGKKPGDKAKDDKGKGKKGEKPKAGKEKPKAGEKPKGEKPKAGDKPKAEKPKADKVEKPKADKAEKPKADKAEKPKGEKAEKPKAEKAEKPKVEKPKGEEKPKAEKPKAQKPKAEKPKAEETPAA